MKSIFYIAIAVASSAAFAQSPPSSAKPASKDRIQLVSVGEMPLPLPRSEVQTLQVPIAKADDGFSDLRNDPDHVRQFFNNLEVVKGRHVGAREAENFAEMLTSGKSAPAAPFVVGRLSELKVGFTPTSVRTGKLIGVVPQGTIVNGAWTGVER